jgi:DNA-binding MarR family transcriptional regulator
MGTKADLELAVLMAARDYGIGGILFRNALARQFGLNLTESLCLTILGLRGQATPGQLARSTGLTTGAITSLLDRLEAKGILHRRPNPEDRRGVIVEPDPGYARASQGLVAGVGKANQKWVARYSEAELALVRDFLKGMADILEAESAKLEAKPPQDS